MEHRSHHGALIMTAPSVVLQEDRRRHNRDQLTGGQLTIMAKELPTALRKLVCGRPNRVGDPTLHLTSITAWRA